MTAQPLATRLGSLDHTCVACPQCGLRGRCGVVGKGGGCEGEAVVAHACPSFTQVGGAIGADVVRDDNRNVELGRKSP